MKTVADMGPYEYILDLKALDKLSEDELLDKALNDWSIFYNNINQELVDKIFNSDDPLKFQSRINGIAGHVLKTETGYAIRGDCLEELWYYTRRVLWGGKVWLGGVVLISPKEAHTQYWTERYAADYSKMNLKEVLDELYDIAKHIDVDTFGEFGINDWGNFLNNKVDIFYRIQELKNKK